MKNIPMRDTAFDRQGFMVWLNRHGSEIGIPSNPYEVIRYRSLRENGRSGTHIVYRKETGALTWVGDTMHHYRAFLMGEALPGPNEPPRDGVFLRTYPTEEAQQSLNERTRQAILKRDGDECWFCGKPMGADMTIEHLVPKAKGGRNMLANYALAHRVCNNRAAALPLVRKIEMRTKLRESAS